ncbi:MAG: hypothetical protein N5P05_000096 [Chroococcopsis gigantea SAG 12.99]|jgi:uncharacterized Zn finger protein|nr:SWIM zinc finger domain-containing protein [Chlorogloea purpurea SAG 13.99]MDV2998490.1 hypothetical protein [Chroococcopsis gigantea SAG 12.99]
MTLPPLSEALLKRNANAKSYQRGEQYYQQRAVRSLSQRGQVLFATVEGSQSNDYQVSIRFERNEITSAQCTCPYDFDGWCKHIVATLLTCIRQSAKLEERPTLEDMLDCLDEIQTQQLIQELVADDLGLLDKIEYYVNRLAGTTLHSQASFFQEQGYSAPTSPLPTIDVAPYRRQVRQILRDAVRALEEGWEDEAIPSELYELIDEAREFTEKGDGHNAIAILEAITDACVDNWQEIEEYGADNDDVAQILNGIWTEAILITELTSSEKATLKENLESWQNLWDADFATSLEALRQGWDYPPLQRILQGEIRGVWEGETPHYANNLTLIRLKILEQQKRYSEYLYLAQAEGQTEQFLIMLAQLNRIDEVMELADQKLTGMEEAFALAQVLLGQGSTYEALEIAKRGLILPGDRNYELANWTSKLAEDLDETDIALAAKIKAFQAKPNFIDYQKIETLALEDWAILKEDLLDYLRSYEGWGSGIDKAKVNIFLHEGLVSDAIAVVDKKAGYYYDSDLVRQVMDSAISEYPDWVIENAKRRAEDIMDAKKAEYYRVAVEWLQKAKAAYSQAGKQADWSAYRTRIMETHVRKYKLIGLLKEI